MSNLVARVDRSDGAVCLASRADRRAGGGSVGLIIRDLGRRERFVHGGIFEIGHVGQWWRRRQVAQMGLKSSCDARIEGFWATVSPP